MDKPKKSAKKTISIIIFIIGFVTLAAGAVMFVLDWLKKPAVEDAEYFVSIGEWVEQDSDGVIWKFTEIGKGTLTTNNHTDDYDFIWSLEGNRLKIETAWLYDLEDEFTYTLDQKENTLKLESDGKTVTFVPKSKPTEE